MKTCQMNTNQLLETKKHSSYINIGGADLADLHLQYICMDYETIVRSFKNVL